MKPYFKEDSWLGSILGRPAFALEKEADLLSASLSKKEFNAFLKTPALFCYAKMDPDKVDQLAFLESVGFRLVDTNLVFNKVIGSSTNLEISSTLRFANAKDETDVVKVAEESFRYSRFHLDPGFTLDIANKIKAEWTRNFFKQKRGTHLVVSESDGRIAGFLLLIGQGSALTIDLIAVSSRARRMGLARSMINFAERELTQFQELRVGTQVANVPSVRLYEGLGFRLSQAHYVLHFHSVSSSLSSN